MSLYIAKINRKTDKGTGTNEVCIFYKPEDYRDYVRFNKSTCKNISHHQKLPDTARPVTTQDLTKKVLKMLDFIDEIANNTPEIA